jgi:transcription initiation factor IIE alpha subunit
MIQASTTTTTDPKFSPQKYRGHTLEILGVLSEFGGLTTREISNKTGLDTHVVRVYCSRGYRQGILDRKERWGWSASPSGMLVLSINTTTTTTSNTTATQQQHNSNTKAAQPLRQLSLAAFTSREDITETDQKVVVELTGHYERTGVKYRLFKDEYELAEAMKIPVVDVLPTLRHLREEGCIYFRRDSLGWKIGLMKLFVWRLQNA